jgi:hypothetical protein
LENLKRALKAYDTEGTASWARKALEDKIDPIEAIDALIGAITEVGYALGKG